MLLKYLRRSPRSQSIWRRSRGICAYAQRLTGEGGDGRGGEEGRSDDVEGEGGEEERRCAMDGDTVVCDRSYHAAVLVPQEVLWYGVAVVCDRSSCLPAARRYDATASQKD